MEQGLADAGQQLQQPLGERGPPQRHRMHQERRHFKSKKSIIGGHRQFVLNGLLNQSV